MIHPDIPQEIADRQKVFLAVFLRQKVLPFPNVAPSSALWRVFSFRRYVDQILRISPGLESVNIQNKE
jgi:hypothetical protein